MRDKLIESINKTVDEFQCLGADNIADRILEEIPDIKYSFDQGVVYACARLIEMFDQPTMALSIFNESRVDPKKAVEYDLEFLRREDKTIPKGKN